jgi:phage regulator Rha-like protein
MPSLPVPLERIERRIYLIRGQKVMLDSGLAELYQVPTKQLNQAVKRNLDRFPEDFMFQLSDHELANWRSQIATSNPAAKMGLRRPPYAFTEHGVAMLSSVLNSARAVQMNILIIRAFVKLRETLATHKDLARKMEHLEATQKQHSSIITIVVEEIQKLKKTPVSSPKRRIGF